MKVSEIFRSNYLRAADLNGKDVDYKVERVEWKELGNDEKAVVYFRNNERGLVLNKTNAATIADSYGDDMDDWVGKSIILFPTRVDFQGQMRDAIRVRISKQDLNQPLEDEVPF